MKKHALLFLLALSGITAVAAPAIAVQTTPAERARAEAVRLQEEGNRTAMLRAARMYQHAAALRDAADAEAVDDLLMAARLLHYVDRDMAARFTMLEAAKRALALGDVVQAGEAYAYAAWLAERDGRADLVLDYAAKAKRLAGSPLLSESQRSLILRHFSPEVLAGV